jgi:hypothetical protein
MKKILVLLFCLVFIANVFAINPNVPYSQPSLTDPVGMGSLLVQEWSFGSIDLAFIILSIVTAFLMIRYGLPMSIIAVSVMGFATVFGFGFNSIIAYGVLIVGIILISLMVVVNLLAKTQY